MSVTSSPVNSTWGLIEWAVTGLATLLASIGAFVWRLMLRLETIEATLTRARQDLDQSRQASETAAQRLAERFDQLHDDHFRLRETISSLPTRADLQSLDEHIADRLEALAARLDRVIDA